MKIGVITDGYVNANGTLDYLKILLRGFCSRKDTEVCLFFTSENQRKLVSFPIWVRKIYELIFPFQHNNSTDAFSEFKELSIVECKVCDLRKQIIENKIDVVFPAMIDLGKNFPVKWAVEYYDCQPNYYPQYFSLKTKKGREFFYITSSKHADVVFVNSQTAKRDFCKFFNIPTDKIEVLPFCATLNTTFIEKDDLTVKDKYGLNKPYFLISNQFYPHKRHDVAFSALKKVRELGHDVMIACTGLMDEEPELVKSLKQMCVDLGLAESVKFLGVLPKQEQIELMKHAISVIQPSEFEGDCSGQIIDAITLGQRAIASDIDVIKEVGFTGYVTYFKLDNVDDLVEKMISFIKTPYSRPSREELIEQEKRFRNAFSKAVYDVLEKMTKK